MSKQSVLPSSPQLTLFAEASPVRTSALLASELASKLLAAAYGLNTCESFRNLVRDGLWLRMSPVERICGLRPLHTGWNPEGMQCFRSRFQRLMWAHRMSEHESSCWVEALRPRMTTVYRSALLPTPRARDYRPGGLGPQLQYTLPILFGGPCHPRFYEWMMGFPRDWTSAISIDASKHSATPSCPDAPRLSGTSSGK